MQLRRPSVIRAVCPDNPRRSIARPRLYKLIDEATRSPVTLLIAPAGTGKTTLLAAWVDQLAGAGDQKVHWLSAHHHLALERSLVLAAGVDAATARELTSETRAEPLDMSAWLLPAMEEAVDGGNQPELVVIDDAHLLPSAQIALISNIVTKCPEVVRLLLASRKDLPLPASSWRSAEWLAHFAPTTCASQPTKAWRSSTRTPKTPRTPPCGCCRNVWAVGRQRWSSAPAP